MIKVYTCSIGNNYSVGLCTKHQAPKVREKQEIEKGHFLCCRAVVNLCLAIAVIFHHNIFICSGK